MDLHYNKHAKGYVTKLNVLVPQMDAARSAGDFKLFTKLMDQYMFNAGGHFNHEFFWESLAPYSSPYRLGGIGGIEPALTSNLSQLIRREWGSLENFKTFFSSESSAI